MHLLNFFIGAPKCATASIYEVLSKHPDLCLYEPKEPYFS